MDYNYYNYLPNYPANKSNYIYLTNTATTNPKTINMNSDNNSFTLSNHYTWRSPIKNNILYNKSNIPNVSIPNNNYHINNITEVGNNYGATVHKINNNLGERLIGNNNFVDLSRVNILTDPQYRKNIPNHNNNIINIINNNNNSMNQMLNPQFINERNGQPNIMWPTALLTNPNTMNMPIIQNNHQIYNNGNNVKEDKINYFFNAKNEITKPNANNIIIQGKIDNNANNLNKYNIDNNTNIIQRVKDDNNIINNNINTVKIDNNPNISNNQNIINELKNETNDINPNKINEKQIFQNNKVGNIPQDNINNNNINKNNINNNIQNQTNLNNINKNLVQNDVNPKDNYKKKANVNSVNNVKNKANNENKQNTNNSYENIATVKKLEEGQANIPAPTPIKKRPLNNSDYFNIIYKDIGMINLGNTCFINSCLQVLIHCPLFIYSFFNKHQRINKNDTLISAYFFEVCIAMMETVNTQEKYIDITNFKSVFGNKHQIFEGYLQNDSQEFCRIFLEDLNTELNEIKNMGLYRLLTNSNKQSKVYKDKEFHENFTSREKSIITDIFYSQIITTFTCQCKNSIYSFQKILDYPLLLPENIQTIDIFNLLRLYFQKEEIEFERNCDFCQKKLKHIKQQKISRPPEILILSFQRINPVAQKKNECLVLFPQKLNITEFIDPELGFNTEPNYNLFAVINHSGSMDYGHYYSFIKFFKTEDWYLFNDSQVKKLGKIDDKFPYAYALFYIKDKYFSSIKVQ